MKPATASPTLSALLAARAALRACPWTDYPRRRDLAAAVDAEEKAATAAALASDPAAIVSGFRALALSRSAVRLESGNYQGARDAYLADRNNIRRDTRRLEKALRSLALPEAHRPGEVAAALISAARDTWGGRVSFDPASGWNYTAGQYQQTEIRAACARVAEAAHRLIYPEAATV